MEMQQLVGMGFSSELASQALAATGGKSTVRATEWILAHNSNPHSPPFQRKLDCFFQFPSKSPEQISHGDGEGSVSESAAVTKRAKLRTASTEEVKLAPLAERMRPLSIDDVIGQDHLVRDCSILRSAVRCNRLPSIILWGPPGTGKTTIAKAIVNSRDEHSSYRFVSLSAVNCGVKDVRNAVDEARKIGANWGKKTVLFMDEVHRFSKSQQDSFLPCIEDGSIVFIGATTENPSFHLVTPLLSRCRVLLLNPLKPTDVTVLLNRAIADSSKGLVKSVGCKLDVMEEAVDFISANCDGDARVALNTLEISATNSLSRVLNNREEEEEEDRPKIRSMEEMGLTLTVTMEDVKQAIQWKHLAYDKDGEEHYNLISALHKSMRWSDPDASLYWLARMLEGGEDPLYIARRLVRFASEDVGLADPLALNQAVACHQACHFVGMPECDVVLAQCVAYLAMAPKSVAVYKAMEEAKKVVRESVGGNESVPLHLRNAPTKLMRDIGYGKGYLYPPDNPSSMQAYLPPSLKGYKFLDWPPRDGTK